MAKEQQLRKIKKLQREFDGVTRGLARDEVRRIREDNLTPEEQKLPLFQTAVRIQREMRRIQRRIEKDARAILPLAATA